VTHEGGCLCGDVRYRVNGPLRDILVCHCTECRRWAGRAWAATACRRQDFELLSAEAVAWVSSPQSVSRASRAFCRTCGSALFWEAPGRETISIAPGTLDDPAGLEVVAHIWVEHAPAWEPPPDGLPAYPQGYPDEAPPLGWR